MQVTQQKGHFIVKMSFLSPELKMDQDLKNLPVDPFASGIASMVVKKK